MRVLHIYSGNLYGGIETILLTLARSRGLCPALELEVALCFEGRLSRELEAAGVRVHQLSEVRVSRPQTVLRARRALGALVATRHFDRAICHAPWAQAIFGRVLARARVPLVFWAHDAMTGTHWTERWARRTPPDLVICNSQFTARSLGTLYDRVPAVVIYAPVNVTPPSLPIEERRAIRAALNTPDNAVVIIQASRSGASKGHVVLLEALACLRDVPNWVWWQVGGAQRPDEAAFLESLSAAAVRLEIADRVRFVGERTDVPFLLAAADVFCQANLGPEAFGIVFVEACAAGLPVVATNVGGVLEIVDDSCGILVPPRDPGAFAVALERLLLDPALRARLAAAAPERARQLCDPATQINRLADALARMAPAETN